MEIIFLNVDVLVVHAVGYVRIPHEIFIQYYTKIFDIM
jgi:hypothetical protein